MQQVRLFFIALQFFTRLPIPAWVGFEASWLQHASRYFPLVGCVVAAIAGAVYFLAALVLPAPVAAVLSTAATIYITGAFHEDGFADTCDGLGGGMTRERALEIMKDSRVGAYGAIGIVCMLAAKLAALSLLPPRLAVASLFIAHPLSRLAATALIWQLDYVRGEGKAKPLAQQMSTGEFAIAAFTCLLPVAILLGTGWIAPGAVLSAIPAAAGAALWLAHKFVRRLGGYTGDCLGAVQQLAEVFIYIAILATLGHGAWPA